jgi:hypothetical protein
MKLEKGTSRAALVGEKLTIKIPIFDIPRLIKDIRSALQGNGMLREFLSGAERTGTLAFFLRGLRENRREASLSSELADLAVPTRLSVLGIVNIQDSAPEILSPEDEIYSAFWRKLVDSTDFSSITEGDERIMRRGVHTLQQSDNFGTHMGRIKLRDYGEKGLDELLRKYGKLLKEVLEEKMAEIQAR